MSRASGSFCARRPSWQCGALLAAAGLAAFLPGLGRHDLWNPDEPRYAEVAQEMLDSGDYLVPHLNGAVYTQKPPLHFWAIAAAGALRGGVDETAARLPSALAVVAAVLAVWGMGRRLYNPRAGLLAAIAFLGCGKVLWQGRVGQIDMMLTALLSAAVYFWLRGYLEGRPALYRLFFLFAALATLAKGPVGLLPPLLAIVAYLLLAGERRELARLRIGSGLALWAAVVLAWLVPAAISAGGDYLRELTLTQNLVRYRAAEAFAATGGHLKPWYYYLTIVPIEFLPWSAALPAALAALAARRDPAARRALLFPLCWVVMTLLFFSLSPAKRSVYMLTLYPALALLAGAGLDRIATDWRRRGLLAAGLGAVAVLFAAAAVVSHVALPGQEELEVLPAAFFRGTTAALATLAAAAVAALTLVWRGRTVPAALTLGGAVAALAAGSACWLLPPYDALKSPRPLATEVAARLQPGVPHAHYSGLLPHYLFYVRQAAGERREGAARAGSESEDRMYFAVVLRDEEELRAYATASPNPLILARREELRGLDPPLPLVELAADPPRRGGYVLLGRPPAPH